MKTSIPVLLILVFFGSACSDKQQSEIKDERMRVIIDTDANNELDDQHALAYLFFNSKTFNTLAVTVNATYNGGDISGHLAEAERVMQLCDVSKEIPLLAGANGNFEEIRSDLQSESFDGQTAVDFIIEQARNSTGNKLVLLPIGKLTNIALALEKAPDIQSKVRIVWLGSNYPEKGEYNQENDLLALNYILDLEVPFEMVMVRYGQPSGSDAVRATPKDIEEKMKGIGPVVSPVEGRHGGTFITFGDYSINLFSKIDLHGDPPSRALFDMVAVAILKNPNWGEKKEIPAPRLVGEEWQERPENPRKVVVWENFNSEEILKDFYQTMNSSGN